MAEWMRSGSSRDDDDANVRSKGGEDVGNGRARCSDGPVQMRGKGGAGPMHQNIWIEISSVSQATVVPLSGQTSLLIHPHLIPYRTLIHHVCLSRTSCATSRGIFLLCLLFAPPHQRQERWARQEGQDLLRVPWPLPPPLPSLCSRLHRGRQEFAEGREESGECAMEEEEEGGEE